MCSVDVIRHVLQIHVTSEHFLSDSQLSGVTEFDKPLKIKEIHIYQDGMLLFQIGSSSGVFVESYSWTGPDVFSMMCCLEYFLQ